MPHRLALLWLAALAAIAAMAAPPCSGQPAVRPTRNILVLNSYQAGPDWVERINEGIRSAFAAETRFEPVFRYEYMNVLDSDPARYAQVYGLRLAGFPLDLVLCVDNPALEFVVANRQRFFREVPVVFASVDNFSQRLLQGQTRITGVSEEQDLASTLWLALRLHPRTRRIIVLANRRIVAENGSYRRLLRLVREEFPPGLDLRFWEDPPLEEVLRRGPGLPQDTVVVAMSFFLDRDGRPLPLASSLREVSRALSVPMYSSWEPLLGNGIVGGMISGGFQQGQAAGWLGLRILKGENPDSIPVLEQSANRYVFDYAQLRRFGISLKQLPEGSELINRPVGFFERYRTVIWVAAVVIALLAAALVLSWVYALIQSRLQRLIQESEQRLSTALEASGAGIWEYDPPTGRVYFDPRWFGMLGYEADELPQRYATWAGLLHPDDREMSEQALRRHVAEGTDFKLEFRLHAKDGSWRWIQSNGTILERDGTGRVLRLVGIHLDVTSSRTTEEVIRESARRYHFLYEKSPSISLIIDLQGRIQDVNGSFVSLLGYEKEEVLGQPAVELVVPEHRQRVAAQLARDLRGEPTPQLDVDVLARDGSVRTVLFSESSAMLFEGETPTGILVTGMDITERKRAMEQARQQQQQLIQADKMSSLGVLVSGVAHEINNPNNFIMLNGRIFSRVWADIQPLLRQYYEAHGEFLLAGMPYSEAQPRIGQLIAGLHEGAQRIKRIVQSLRDFARRDTGDLERPVDLNAVVESSIVLVRNLLDKSTSRFSLSLAPGLPALRGNFQQLEQVLINLITNACQALPDRERGIRVETAVEEGYVRVEVRDQGVGIPEENLERILDPFFTTKQDTGGTGLGLSISYNIVKNHGGDLAIRSRPGEGTTAVVRLPAAPTAPAAPGEGTP
jgi:PAS domain S-box-containing protein